MAAPLVCITLTGKTLKENLEIIRKYEKYIDLVELRVDCLYEEEQLFVRRFPSMIRFPCILTIRRDIDGGFFNAGEFSRTNLFARAIAFADPDRRKNFAYVDLEDDFRVPSIQDAAMAFGVKIIRSLYSLKEPIYNLKERCDLMRTTGYEIPKIVFTPKKLSDVANLFLEGKKITDYDHILCATGREGLPSKILSKLSNSYLTYSLPKDLITDYYEEEALDPVKLRSLYNFDSISTYTDLFGITGYPFSKQEALELHNIGFLAHKLNSVTIPIQSKLVSEAISFADQIGIKGLAISSPHKESALYYVDEQSQNVVHTGVCNTIIKVNSIWKGYNTDLSGFSRALKEFLGDYKIKRKKVAIIGAGSAARSVAYVLKQMGARACIFNRTVEHARNLADRYGFEYCNLEPDCASVLDEYSYLIIQTTNVGMYTENSSTEIYDPIPFYNFRGNEMFFDLIYKSSITPVMKRASLAGCRVTNGYKMFEYKSYEQFKLFTKIDY